MTSPREIRKCALQGLYQFDAAGTDSPDMVRESLNDAPGSAQTHDEGFALAQATWEHREAADAAVSALTPEWPIHRQPVIDRNLLRMAFYEMTSGRTPPKVVINEAVELAKEFSTEKSPMFINGVLDKLYRQMRGEEDPAPGINAPGINDPPDTEIAAADIDPDSESLPDPESPAPLDRETEATTEA